MIMAWVVPGTTYQAVVRVLLDRPDRSSSRSRPCPGTAPGAGVLRRSEELGQRPDKLGGIRPRHVVEVRGIRRERVGGALSPVRAEVELLPGQTVRMDVRAVTSLPLARYRLPSMWSNDLFSSIRITMF